MSRRKQLGIREDELRSFLATSENRRFAFDHFVARCGLLEDVPTGPEGVRLLGRRSVAIEFLLEAFDVAPQHTAALAVEAIERRLSAKLLEQQKQDRSTDTENDG